MGATSWKYFVPYKENVEEALEQLKQQEFEAGRYGLQDDILQIMEKKAKELNLDEEKLEEFRTAYNNLQKLKGKSQRKPTTIQQLLKKSKDSGTHSIIDIPTISSSTDKNVSGTLSEAELISLFGTVKPNRKMIDTKSEELLEYRERGLCTYIVVYHDDTAQELYFTGHSGD